MYTTTWEEILGRKDLVGGEIWTYDGNGDRQVVTRALICGLKEEGGSVFVQSSWCVRQRGSADRRLGEKWHSVTPPVQARLRRNSSLTAIGSDESGASHRIMIGSPSSRHEISFWHMLRPKGDDTFDPKDADFFPERWERLLALYPMATEGNQRTAIAKVCLERKRFACYLDVVVASPPLFHFIANILEHNETREEFLQCYLEALTGETKIHERVF